MNFRSRSKAIVFGSWFSFKCGQEKPKRTTTSHTVVMFLTVSQVMWSPPNRVSYSELLIRLSGGESRITVANEGWRWRLGIGYEPPYYEPPYYESPYFCGAYVWRHSTTARTNFSPQKYGGSYFYMAVDMAPFQKCGAIPEFDFR